MDRTGVVDVVDTVAVELVAVVVVSVVEVVVDCDVVVFASAALVVGLATFSSVP